MDRLHSYTSSNQNFNGRFLKFRLWVSVEYRRSFSLHKYCNFNFINDEFVEFKTIVFEVPRDAPLKERVMPRQVANLMALSNPERRNGTGTHSE